MKKSFIFLFVASLMISAACTKEINNVNNNSTDSDNNPLSGVITFTASIPEDTKSYDGEGKVTWEVGDSLLIINDKGSSSQTAWANSVKVAVGDAGTSVSADGKHFTFSINTASLPDGGTRFYAIAFSGFEFLGKMVWSISNSGRIALMPYNVCRPGTRTHLALATCSAAQTTLSFKPVLSVFKFNTSSTGQITHLTFTDNDGSNFVRQNGVTISPEGNLSIDISTSGRAELRACVVPAGHGPENSLPGTYYACVAPGTTFANGIKIAAYGNWGQSTLVGQVVTSKSFTTQAGKLYDLGTIEDHFETTYYEDWEAGKDIEIAGVKYNKAAWQAAGYYTLHITANTSMTAGAAGIYFIDEGCTLTTQGGAYSNPVIFVGNTKGTRSKVNLNNPLRLDNTNSWLLKNMEVEANSSVKFINLDSAPIDKLVIDDCKIDMNTTFCNRIASDKSVNELTIIDSDIIVTANNQSFLYTHAAAGQQFGTIKVKNNVFWSPDGTIKNLFITDAPYANGADIDNIIFENNTFYNVATNGSGGGRAFFGFRTIGTSISCKSNLYYTTTTANTDGSVGSVMVFYTKGMTANDTWAKVTNNVNSFTNYAWNCAVRGSDTSLWYHGITKDATATPFDSFNTTTGAFVIKDAYKQYGASR